MFLTYEASRSENLVFVVGVFDGITAPPRLFRGYFNNIYPIDITETVAVRVPGLHNLHLSR
jgi:hypothetical protein